MTKNKIIKFLNNRCTSGELEEIIRWTNTEAFSEEGTRWAFDDWRSYREEGNAEDDEKFSLLFDKIQQKINSESRKNKNTETWKPVFITWLTRAAAILLLPVLAFLFYTLSENAEIKMESAQFGKSSCRFSGDYCAHRLTERGAVIRWLRGSFKFWQPAEIS